MATLTESAVLTRPKVGFVSLGCPKNLVDSEVMMGMLHHNGAELIQKADDADIIVINTCSFIDSAKQESVNTILEMVKHKREHGGKASRIVVAGCLVERYRDEIRANIPEVDAVVGTGELEAILQAAGLTPQSDSPFRILPQDFAQPTIEAHTQAGLELLPDALVGETLVSRAPSAVNQHSRPLEAEQGSQLRVLPQLGIAQSLAETGTTTDHVNHAGNHIVHDAAAGTQGREPVAFRAEGDAREQAGRFSREAWDGATAALPDYLYSDATPRILIDAAGFGLHQDCRGLRSSLLVLHHSAAAGQVPVAAHGVDYCRGAEPDCAGCAGDYADRAGHDLLWRRPGAEGGPGAVARCAGTAAGAALAAVFVYVPEQGFDAAAGNDGQA